MGVPQVVVDVLASCEIVEIQRKVGAFSIQGWLGSRSWCHWSRSLAANRDGLKSWWCGRLESRHTLRHLDRRKERWETMSQSTTQRNSNNFDITYSILLPSASSGTKHCVSLHGLFEWLSFHRWLQPAPGGGISRSRTSWFTVENLALTGLRGFYDHTYLQRRFSRKTALVRVLVLVR